MAIRTIDHPGVQINEADKSQFAPAIVGTAVYFMGYTDKGQEYQYTQPISMDEYTSMYGSPTNEAERYSYYAARDVLIKGGNLVFSKLPYQSAMAHNYKGMGLTFSGSRPITSTDSADLIAVSAADFYSNVAVINQGVSESVPTASYDYLVEGYGLNEIPVPITHDFLIINTQKAQFSGPKANEGVFVAIVDQVHAMKIQRMLPNPSDSDTFELINGINSPSGIVLTDFGTPLTGSYVGDSVSEAIVKKFPSINFSENGNTIDPSYAQYIGVVVCRTVSNPQNEGKLEVAIVEAFAGSIHSTKRDPSTGLSVYIGDLINGQSNYIKWFSSKIPIYGLPSDVDTSVTLYVEDGPTELLGFTAADAAKKIKVQALPGDTNTMSHDIKICLEKVSNIDELQIDVVEDAGLSTIAMYCSTAGALSGDGEIYDPVYDVEDNEPITTSTQVDYWRSTCNLLIDFCQNVRKDCMVVLDVPRTLCLQGNAKFLRVTNPTNTFSNTIGASLRFVTGLNSSYAAIYSDWMKMIDASSGVPFWLPPSIKAAGVYVNTDRVANFWDAPAGLNRGQLTDIVDLAFNPNDKAMDQLYTKSFNYAKQYPIDGFILEGQKTTQAKPSAFDRVNVRRLFLRLERLAYKVARYFVYEPNNMFTRRRLIAVLDPVFKSVQSAGGIYDYMIVCDQSNNTAEVIDRNELKVAILIKPTRTAEFIIVDFVATRTDANFQEIIQEIIA